LSGANAQAGNRKGYAPPAGQGAPACEKPAKATPRNRAQEGGITPADRENLERAMNRNILQSLPGERARQRGN
jgi:hypothetical protein